MEERYVPFACSLLTGLEVVGEHLGKFRKDAVVLARILILRSEI